MKAILRSPPPDRYKSLSSSRLQRLSDSQQICVHQFQVKAYYALSRLPDDAWTGEDYLSVEKCRAMVRNANAFVGGRGRPKAYLYLCNNVTHSE